MDIFKNETGKLEPPHGNVTIKAGVAFATDQDMYFVAKWNELLGRYNAARLFLRKTQEEDWDYWFMRLEDEDFQKAAELYIKSNLYETALINYNILVDLSWAITYVSAEYALYSFDKEGNITNVKEVRGMHPIEEAYSLLRKTEEGVSTPHAKGNPFDYLKTMAPEFSSAVDLIIDFWKEFSNSDIRNLYNYIKHKGKPIYKEIEETLGGKAVHFWIGKEEYPSDIRDVQKIISLEDGIKELIDFDDNILFPYIEHLIEELIIAVNPSPMAYM
ncbi:MAG: hypothetical protein J1F42_04505 [Lachnospiraceae bacterium]|nr:hypothetical protein [Lachnospiraceae bacterium]